MGILEGLAAKVAGDRSFNQNADRYVPGVVTPDTYNRGISEQDAYKLELARRAQEANYLKNQQIMQNAAVNRENVIDPRYWDAAQKASDYELRGLAGRAGR